MKSQPCHTSVQPYRLPTPLLLGAAAVASCSIAAQATGQLATYTQDFEGLDRTNPNALAADGWRFFGNAFDSSGAFQYGYGVFIAPNDIASPNISVISDVPSGGNPPAGAQGLVVLADYNNGDQDALGNNFTINANVFQERPSIAAADIGKVFRWEGLYSAPAAPPAGASTASAFIRTLDPNNGFLLTNNVQFDTTAAPGTPETFQVTIDLSDPALQGQILQFGFDNNVNDFEDSAVNYDDLQFAEFTPLLGDLDFNDQVDLVDVDIFQTRIGTTGPLSTVSQGDVVTDGTIDGNDGAFIIQSIIGTEFGDLDADGDVDGLDFNTFAINFGQPGTYSQGDLDFDGDIDGLDFNTFAINFGFTNAPAVLGLLESGDVGGALAAAGVSAVPEPASLALLGLGGLLAARRRRAA